MDCLLLGTSCQIGTACLLLAWEEVFTGFTDGVYMGFNDGTFALLRKMLSIRGQHFPSGL